MVWNIEICTILSGLVRTTLPDIKASNTSAQPFSIADFRLRCSPLRSKGGPRFAEHGFITLNCYKVGIRCKHVLTILQLL